MKPFSEIMKQLNEADEVTPEVEGDEEGSDVSTENELADVLAQIEDMYVEESGDDDLEDYDLGLMILSEFADRIPEDVAEEIVAELKDAFDLDSTEVDESMMLEFKKKSASIRKAMAKARKKWAKTASGKASLKRSAKRAKRPHHIDKAASKIAKKAAAMY